MDLKADTFVVGYGSLLSHDSRLRFSGIDTKLIPVNLAGWRRSWSGRCSDERVTYAGASPRVGASMNAALMPTEEISPELRARERNYNFVAVTVDQLTFYGSDDRQAAWAETLAHKKLYICDIIDPISARADFPILQSYVDTCIAGCFETEIPDFAAQFVRTTCGWENGWINDRQQPRYPRAARISEETRDQIDQLLDACDVLKFREE